MFKKKYAKHYDGFNHGKDYKKEIEFVYKWALAPSRIMDIGCGTACYWDYLPKDIFIFGVEKSGSMIMQSKHRRRILHHDILQGVSCAYPKEVELVTALFDVMNYIPVHTWWEKLPLKRGGYFIFDIWDKKKVDEDGFKVTQKISGGVIRTIMPYKYDGKKIDLRITVTDGRSLYAEMHRMYIWSDEDIAQFCGKEFSIIETRETETWQKWYKLRKDG